MVLLTQSGKGWEHKSWTLQETSWAFWMGVKRRLPTHCKHCLTAVLFCVCMFESSRDRACLNGLLGEGAGQPFKVQTTSNQSLYAPSRVLGNLRAWKWMSKQLSSQGPGIILTPLRGMAHAGPLWSCCFQYMEVKLCQRGSKWTVPIVVSVP